MRWFCFTCPLCGADRQHFPLITFRRRVRMRCGGCGVLFRSEPGALAYGLYLLYIQFVALLTCIPVIWAFAGQRWGWLGAIWMTALALCKLPEMALHARSPICRDTPDPDRSYARRPGAVDQAAQRGAPPSKAAHRIRSDQKEH